MNNHQQRCIIYLDPPKLKLDIAVVDKLSEGEHDDGGNADQILREQFELVVSFLLEGLGMAENNEAQDVHRVVEHHLELRKSGHLDGND